jgi:hypothetical protein
MRTSTRLVIAAALVLTPALGLAADARDIAVINRTGKPVLSLFVSPVDSEEWEEDILGVDVLEDGQTVKISFSGYDDEQCHFDLLATDEDDNEWLLPDVNLCEVVDITITAKYIRAE